MRAQHAALCSAAPPGGYIGGDAGGDAGGYIDGYVGGAIERVVQRYAAPHLRPSDILKRVVSGSAGAACWSLRALLRYAHEELEHHSVGHSDDPSGDHSGLGGAGGCTAAGSGVGGAEGSEAELTARAWNTTRGLACEGPGDWQR